MLKNYFKIALLTVSFQALKVMGADPVDCLHSFP
jgi:hypothetical protein